MRTVAETFELRCSTAIDLKGTLMGGQAFRWRRDSNGWFSGVVQSSIIKLHATGDGIEVRTALPEQQARLLLSSYFRLDDDLKEIYSEICRDENIARLVRKYPGLRLLRQDPWECLVCFLCSANNNINQISRIADRLANAFGSPIELDGDRGNAFPTPAQFVSAGPRRLKDLRLGLKRGENIYKASLEVVEGLLDLEELRAGGLKAARQRLLKCVGVGDKIANCVLLFSLDKLDAFPIDRHIGRALALEYFPDLPPPSSNELPHWNALFEEHFGRYAGYAGQFLFHDRLQESER